MTEPETKQRQVAYWRLIGATFGLQEISAPFERMIAEIAQELDLPTPLLDEKMGIDVLLTRYPKLRPHFESLKDVVPQSDPDEEGSEDSPAPLAAPPPSEGSMERTLVFSKLMLNVFGP